MQNGRYQVVKLLVLDPRILAAEPGGESPCRNQQSVAQESSHLRQTVSLPPIAFIRAVRLDPTKAFSDGLLNQLVDRLAIQPPTSLPLRTRQLIQNASRTRTRSTALSVASGQQFQLRCSITDASLPSPMPSSASLRIEQVRTAHLNQHYDLGRLGGGVAGFNHKFGR